MANVILLFLKILLQVQLIRLFFAWWKPKKNDFDLGKPQCMAQMIGARMYNQKYGKNIETIYGCVTIGTEWLFLKLDGNEIWD